MKIVPTLYKMIEKVKRDKSKVIHILLGEY